MATRAVLGRMMRQPATIPAVRPRTPSRPIRAMTAQMPTAMTTQPATANKTLSLPLLSQVQTRARPDSVLIVVVLALSLLGLIMVQSASQFFDQIDPSEIARRDALWFGLGVVGLIVTTRVDYHVWRHVAIPGLVGAFVLLSLVLHSGVSLGGAQRWLILGPITFQPSEIAKLAFILFAADRLAPREGKASPRRMKQVAIVAGMMIAIVVLLQNDLGTGSVLGACAFVLLVMAETPLLPFVLGTLGLLAGGALVTSLSAFRRARVLGFLHPLECDSSYHVCQSLIAIGSGGVFGRGLGASVQKAGYLPAPFTDSIYAVIGEELGLWGAILVIGLFVAFLWRGWRLAQCAPDAFGALLALGITCWVVVQAVLNIGSNVAAIPFTGVPLPFISFGGSSLVVTMAAVGILLNISTQQVRQR